MKNNKEESENEKSAEKDNGSASCRGHGRSHGGLRRQPGSHTRDETTKAVEQSAGEGGDETDAATEPAIQMEDTTINIRVMNEFRNVDKVLEQYEEMTKDDPIMSKIHLNFSYVAGGDYKDRLTMAMVGQEDYDLMFCGSWHGLSTFIKQGNFADLSEYFNNDAYPGLKAAFSEDFVEAMTSYIRQEDGTYKTGIYGLIWLPIMRIPEVSCTERICARNITVIPSPMKRACWHM